MPNDIHILRELKQLLKSQFHDDIRDVLLFGSRATGTARDDSDYDLLIVLNGAYDWRYKRQIQYACYDIDLKYDILTDTHIISIDEIQHSLKGQEPLYVNALQKGIPL